MEPLDFPLGLGVTGGTVFLSNTQCREEVFETVAAAGEAGSVNTSIVRQRGRWQAVVVNVVAESIDHNLAGDAGVGVQGEQISGVVIEPVDDFNISPIGEAPMGEIWLTTLVGCPAWKRMQDDLGRFLHPGMTSLSRLRVRLMVERAESKGGSSEQGHPRKIPYAATQEQTVANFGGPRCELLNWSGAAEERELRAARTRGRDNPEPLGPRGHELSPLRAGTHWVKRLPWFRNRPKSAEVKWFQDPVAGSES